MASCTYEIDLDMNCPRCGHDKAIVGVYYLGGTHVPQCAKCGLSDGRGDAQSMAASIMLNCFYEWKGAQKIQGVGDEK